MMSLGPRPSASRSSETPRVHRLQERRGQVEAFQSPVVSAGHHVQQVASQARLHRTCS